MASTARSSVTSQARPRAWPPRFPIHAAQSRALSGWNAYLQAAPGGRLATEARYNRAICLLRLGRDAEARQALEPFASGKFGYRQNEARELLEELSR